ncbi:MAG: class I SAM-dependent methyltransferase [Methylococcales bacterium]|nr:class I SAM-dependent methyltransferase [Methylococcales bacterium]
MKCRHCQANLNLPFIDLGTAPPSNAYVGNEALHAPESYYPLRVLVCTGCWLVQTEDYAQAEELFAADYAYFSSFSSTWLQHAEQYVSTMIARFGLSNDSYVIEVAANDGYLLQFAKAREIPCLGIEPTSSTAAAARAKGIPIVEDFFSVRLAGELIAQGKQADLTAANNVLAHVPDINDFVSGFTLLLKPHGVATFEFPHLLKLVEENQFDTIYHEHFSYLSLTAVERIFAANGLKVFDVEELPTHGGSLRVFAQRADTGHHPVGIKVDELLKREVQAGIKTVSYYTGFQAKTDKVKNDFLSFLIEAKRQGKKVAAYGAAAKGNTLMNYAGIRPDLISFVVDRNPAKQGKYMPGSRIPIVDESQLQTAKPDYVVVLPWNLKTEVMQQLEYVKSWNGQFVTAVPNMEVV